MIQTFTYMTQHGFDAISHEHDALQKKRQEYVEIVSYVRVKLKGNEFILHIVGLHEADPLKKKVSYRSPVGSALMNARIGDVVRVNLEDRVSEYEVMGITI